MHPLKRLAMKLPMRPIHSLEILNGMSRFSQFWKQYPAVQIFNNRFDLHSSICRLQDNDAIVFLEFGVFEGATIKFWSANNTNPGSVFYGFDSFEGLPESWLMNRGVGFNKGDFSTRGKTPDVSDARVHFVVGVFQAVLTNWLDTHGPEISQKNLVLHMDADLYTSELFCLSQLYRHLPDHFYLIFDDFSVFQHDYQAFHDWTKSHLIDYKMIARTDNYQQVAIEITAKRKDYR